MDYKVLVPAAILLGQAAAPAITVTVPSNVKEENAPARAEAMYVHLYPRSEYAWGQAEVIQRPAGPPHCRR